QRGFAVICSHALNSLCSLRFCARLARNRWIMVASSPLPARRTCASVSIVRLADSAIGLGQLAVIAYPATQNVTGSIASIPWAAFSIVRSFPCVLTGGGIGAALTSLRGGRGLLWTTTVVVRAAQNHRPRVDV